MSRVKIKSCSKSIKIWKPLDLLVILIVLAGAAACVLFTAGAGQDGGGLEAVIRQDGRTIKTIELSKLNGPEKFTVDGDIPVTVLLQRDGACVVESGCKDKICVKTGMLTRAGQTAVCLPAKVTVELKTASGQTTGQIDAVTG